MAYNPYTDPYSPEYQQAQRRRYGATPGPRTTTPADESVYAPTPAIRSVPMAQGYSADNPPSFHSHVSSPPPGQMAYDGYDEVSQHGGPSRQGFRLDADDSYEPVRLESEYHARSEVDMELRLGNGHERSRTPAVRPGDRARGDAGTHVGFDEEDDGEEQQFEDSFEGNESGLWDEKRDYGEEEEIGSPAVSFVGGFGAPPPTAHLRRNLTNRRVKLTQGNLVLDCAIPTRLMGFLPRKDHDEFALTRYTAVTCPPEEFNSRNYTLRPSIYNRQTELFIVVTLYNENEVLFCRTMHGIMKNIAHLCKRKKSQTWGADGWKKIVVCIVADGRKAIHPRILDCLSALGVYQEGLATNAVDDALTQAHVYENTTQLSIAPDLTFKGLEKGIVPTQIMFCLKEKVAKKLNSHRWALEAFAPQLDPNVVMLIDVGTKPGDRSLYNLWKAFDLNSNVGGACGEIVAMKGKFWLGLLNPLVAAQNFEYKISNILDKPLESICGYITVLPGAFSAYRYIALKNDELGHGPLGSYFKGEHLAGHDASVFESNMYLAEDRVLCFELVSKRGDSWVLKFVKSAQGETDVPDNLSEFIGQRRRWLNGSFFASTYALRHTFRLLQTSHSRRKIAALFLQAIYNVFSLLFSWFGLANYWIFYFILTSSLADPSFKLKGISYVNTVMQSAYMGTVMACFLLSMGNRPKAAKWKYMTVSILLALTTAYMIGAAVFCTIKAVQAMESSILFTQIVVSIASTYGVYVASSLIAGDPWHLITSMVQYILFSPIFINLLNIYAFSNLHDFSWGTKETMTTDLDLGVTKKVGKDTVDMTLPSDQADIDVAYDRSLHNLKTRPMIIPPALSQKAREEATQDFYASVRTNVLLAWVLSNALLVSTILEGDYSNTFSEGGGNGRTQIYLVIILVFVAIMAFVRFIGSTAYVVDRAVRLLGGRFINYFGSRARKSSEASAPKNLTTKTKIASRRPRNKKDRGIGSSNVTASESDGDNESMLEEKERS